MADTTDDPTGVATDTTGTATDPTTRAPSAQAPAPAATATTAAAAPAGATARGAAPASGAAVRLRDLTKRYGGRAAVDRVRLDIEVGEFMTFLGPSGSGKTTTLNMIAGFSSPTEGAITVDGTDVAALPPHKRDLGMVFQHYALFPHMTVAKNVAFPLEQRKVPKAEIARRVTEALRMVELEQLADRLPSRLSGGQQQRVALARAVVFNPRVLLMDEPLGALDKKLREQLQGEISRMHRELGITFVFVTHDQEEALALSDRIAVFNEGRIEQVGTPEELYERPATLFVARFIGESNVFTGRCAKPGTLTGEGYELALPGRGPEGSGRGPVPEGEVALVVRPERMRILAPGDPVPPAHNHLDGGTVTEIVYFGAHRKVTVELPSGDRLHLREPAGQEAPLSVGASARVIWPVERSAVVPVAPVGA
ncbi:ABC transporter ATP-binding protein [Streptomyces sp. NPDC091377]|uniref:ABC transporter ATP-binding protein n=1 Tax=Streptomyces sp. NPDC091377 TaxID=3365995 RepID=UPI0038114015